EEIERQVAHFQAHGCDFEWKVYGADSPPGLREALRRAGFEEDEPEALMVLDVDAFVLPARAQGGIGIHRLEDPDELVELVAFQEAIWAREFPWLLWHL